MDAPRIASLWGARLTTSVQTDPDAHPASCLLGTRVCPGAKRPGRDADQPTHFRAEVANGLALHLRFPSAPAQACDCWPFHSFHYTYICAISVVFILRLTIQFSRGDSYKIFVLVLFHLHPGHLRFLFHGPFSGEYKHNCISAHKPSGAPFSPPLLHPTTAEHQ